MVSVQSLHVPGSSAARTQVIEPGAAARGVPSGIGRCPAVTPRSSASEELVFGEPAAPQDPAQLGECLQLDLPHPLARDTQ